MRKLFTRFLRFLLLSVMMVFSVGVYAQETQSTVELTATSVDKCYNATNSYTSTISVKDFIKMKSFKLTLNYDKSEFVFDAVANVNPLLLGGVTATVVTTNPTLGIVEFTWTSATEVTIGNNIVGGVPVFDAKFKVVNFPNNTGDNLFDSPLTWDVVNSTYYYVANGYDPVLNPALTGSYQVETTRFNNGTMNVPVSYTAADFAYTVTPATCAGGTAKITITSPVATGMKYYFNGSTTASTSPVADAQAPSVNTVRIEDANGCFSHLFTINVSAPNPLVFTGVTNENPLCFEGMGEIQFNISGGSAPYTYWVVPSGAAYTQLIADLNTSGGVTTLPVFAPFKYNNFQVLKPAGDYMVAVNDAAGCLDLRLAANWKNVTITPVTSQVTYTATPTAVTCNGSANGAIAVSAVTGGTGPSYMVSINGAVWFAAPYTFTGLTAGTYALQVKDFNGCTVTSNVVVAQPAAMVFSPTFTDASCSGGTTGSITVPSVTGGTSPYTFAVAIAGAAMPTEGWVAVGGPISTLPANYYSVWVKDVNGCVKPYVNPDGSGNILPIQTPGALSFTTNAEVLNFIDVNCNGGAFTLSVTAAGGIAPYTYSFNGGAYSTTNTLVLTGLTANTVVAVAVMDANSCVTNRNITIDVPTALTIASVSDQLSPTCPLGTDGRITVNATGGIAPYQYSTDNSTWFANKVLALPEGSTNIYVKDAKGCTASTIVVIPSLTLSTITAAPTALIACNGNTTTEGIVITNTWQAGRIIQYYVSSSAATVFTTGSVFVPASVNGVAPTAPAVSTKFGAGTYFVGARDEYGCTSAVKEVKFLQNPALVLGNVTTTNATCSGAIDGSITINTTGGNGIPSYAIVNNFLAIGNLIASDFQPIETYNAETKVGKQIVQTLKGTYYVVLRDACNTTNLLYSGPFVVDGYKPIALAANPIAKTDITCNNLNDGTITVSGVSGGKPEFDGTGLYTYKLYKDGVLVVTTAPNTTGRFTGLGAGAYYVTVTDASNCPLVTTATVTVVNPAVLSISGVAVTHFTCATSNDGVVTITAAGGTGAYMLAVNASVNGLGTDIKASDWITFPTASATKTYIATSAGEYKFYVKDANGCVAVAAPVTVLAPKVITAVATLNTPVSCNGGNDGSIDINATGGFESTTFTHTYTYSLKADFTNANATGIFTGLAAGNYKVYVKTTNAPAPVGNYTYPAVACVYELAFTITAPAEYSYRGKVVKTVSCRGGSDGEFEVTVLSGGTPFVHATTGDEYDVQLTTTASPVLLPGSWTRTSGKVVKFTNLPHAIYSVWIKDSKGCLMPTGIEVLPTPVPVDHVWHKVASWEVQQPGTVLAATVTFNKDVTCFGGNDGKFTINATGGVAPYTYAAVKSILPAHVLVPEPGAAWTTSNVFDQATAATWIIWVKDANGCIVGGEGTILNPINDWRVQIRQPQQVKFNDLTSVDVLCFGGATGKVLVSGIISDAGAPYSFNVSGTDAAGNAVNKDYAGLTAVDGVFTLADLAATETIHVEPTPAHTTHNAYTVKVIDKNGCFATKTVIVWQKPALDVNIVKANGAFVCPGDNNGVIEAVATGGTAPYSYRLWKDGVAFTSWVNIPSFLVEVGSTWKVEVKDASGCIDTDEEVLNAPVGVTATLKETTCFSDTKASVIVKAVGEAGRTFLVRYRLNTDANFGAWLPFTSELAITNLVFANAIATENFYYFEVKDDKGCPVNFTKSFVPTQHPLEVTAVQADDQLTAAVTITGGISPYSYKIGTGAMVNMPADGNTFQVVEMKAPATTITVYDAHGCMVVKTMVIAPLAVTAVPNAGNNQDNEFDVVLTFNRAVTVAAGDITGGTFTPGTGTEFTVAMTGDDMETLTLALGTGIVDAAGNTFAGKTFTYKVGDHVAPTVVVTAPVAPVTTVFTIGLKFSEPVTGVAGGITVTGGTLTDVSGLGDEYVVTVSGVEKAVVTVVLANTIADMSSNTNKFAGQTLTYTIGDFTAPLLVSMDPTIEDVLANNHPLFKMTFSEDVKVGAGGNLVVYKLNTTVPVLTLPITSSMIVGKDVNVTYTTLQGLDKDTRYYVLVDNSAIVDMAGNKYVGIGDVATWTFKTGPAFVTGIDTNPNISEFKVYPNPFVDYVDVVSSSKLSKVVVTNIAGQTVKEVVNPAQRIQLNELRSGIYFISLYDMDNVIAKTAKIVKR